MVFIARFVWFVVKYSKFLVLKILEHHCIHYQHLRYFSFSIDVAKFNELFAVLAPWFLWTQELEVVREKIVKYVWMLGNFYVFLVSCSE